jgi:peptidyl-dipeptidase Dcp
MAATKVDSAPIPLLDDWKSEPFGLPPFAKIKPEHFKPAFEAAMQKHFDDLRAITDSTEFSFQSVSEAFDRAGEQLTKIGKLFGNLCGSLATPELQAVEMEMAGSLSV